MDSFNVVRQFEVGDGKRGRYFSLPALEAAGVGSVSRLPVSLRMVLESLLRNENGRTVSAHHIRALANWQPNAAREEEIPFVVARIMIPDSSGAPLLADLAAMRDVAAELGYDASLVEPSVPVDLVIDHSVQVDHYRGHDALARNMNLEFERNAERYAFFKWAAGAFEQVRVVPPGVGICHQVNLEYLSRGVWEQDGIYYPDTLVGADSHTPMINGLGVVAWGVGGIEADAAMLGQPVYFLTPDVVGVELKGALRPGVTATDAVLTIVNRLRAAKVVGKFVEFFGEGAASLTVPDRATIANMAPEYGATIGFFPIDDQTVAYLKNTGRTAQEVAAFKAYYEAQRMYGIPRPGECDYSSVIEIDLDRIVPSVAGPKRPQDRVAVSELKSRFSELLTLPLADGGYAKPTADARVAVPAAADLPATIGDGDVLLAAITSCTNTSNPGVLVGAALLAKKARERGLSVRPWIKTSFAPGSRVVTEYLARAGLLEPLSSLGFQVVGYGCTTCVGNSGPLDPRIEKALAGSDVVAAAVLSGNRNFEARIHPNLKANFLMSPPLVVAFAIAGTLKIDFDVEALGTDASGKPVFLKDVWPSPAEIAAMMASSIDPELYRKLYANLDDGRGLWSSIPNPTGERFVWDDQSTYFRKPPFFDGIGLTSRAPAPVKGARALGIFGDSLTTDHISPAGTIGADTEAGRYLVELGVPKEKFNSYIARRTNHEVMMRGTFANVRIRNLMVPGSEGGVTRHEPGGEVMSMYDAAMKYREEGVPLIVLGGQEYGTGSSRDWAAKGTQLLGVRAVVASSFERIHRNNLIGMGVLPCQFAPGTSVKTLQLDGSEMFDLEGIEAIREPLQTAILVVRRNGGEQLRVPVVLRIDTPIEVEYYQNGGIMPFVLRSLLKDERQLSSVHV